MKFFFSLLIAFFLFIVGSHANESIRFININYIVNNSDAGVSLNKIIEEKTKKIESELKDLVKKIGDKKDKIVSQKNILKKEEFDKLLRDYEKEVKVFNELKNRKKKDFDNFRVKSKKKILDLLNPIITDFLQKNSIKILLQKEKIIFGDDNLDITEKILKIFNDKHDKIKF
tara:strand:- start:314 stop:829 length:516 start_codon:yes stop_codon:yes gene_type:complete